jgi:hypothetical protein
MSEDFKFEDYENQFNEIEKEKSSRPFVSSILKIDDLLNEYKNGNKQIYKQIEVTFVYFDLKRIFHLFIQLLEELEEMEIVFIELQFLDSWNI